MVALARYYEGLYADFREVVCRLEGGHLAVLDAAQMQPLARWPLESVRLAGSRQGDVRLALRTDANRSRLVFSGQERAEAIGNLLPRVGELKRAEFWRRFRFISASSAVLASVVAGYFVGIPLLARQLTQFVPPAWEMQMGEKFAPQIEASLAENFGFRPCETDPTHAGNVAIARFVDDLLATSETPFDVRVTVAESSMANAFALPGGRVYYLSSLISEAKGPDEFAGVLAHEIGHVVHRHTMTQLISSSGTGLLIGLVLGDLSGISVAASVGTLIVDSSFSRDFEREADSFAGDAANRIGYSPVALAALLERIAADDAFNSALSLLSSHPLTTERRISLEKMVISGAAYGQPFDKNEWKSILALCDAGG